MIDRTDLEMRHAQRPTTLGEFLYWICQDFTHALEAIAMDLVDQKVFITVDSCLGSAGALLGLVVGDDCVYYERGRILITALDNVSDWVDYKQNRDPEPVLVRGDDWLNAPDRPGYFDTEVGLARLRREAKETGYFE
jgi:hypothetical protein